MYPIEELVMASLAGRGWRKRELIAAMGYKDPSRGMRRLEACLRGEGTPDFHARLQRALGVPAAQLADALRATQARQAEERARQEAQTEAARRANFRPYIYVQTRESRPANLTAAAVIGPRLKQIALDHDVLALSRPARLARVGEMVREHYRTNLGKCLLFGEITGYLFRSDYEETIEYTTDGAITARRDGPFAEPGEATLRVHHRVISGGLFTLGMIG